TAGNRRALLITRGVAVDTKLSAQRNSVAGVPLGEDAKAAAVFDLAVPRDDEVAGRIGGDRWEHLAGRGVAVDPELAAQRHSPARVALAKDAILAAVLEVAVPRHDEGAHRIRGD